MLCYNIFAHSSTFLKKIFLLMRAAGITEIFYSKIGDRATENHSLQSLQCGTGTITKKSISSAEALLNGYPGKVLAF
jgi:hypothetical protein